MSDHVHLGVIPIAPWLWSWWQFSEPLAQWRKLCRIRRGVAPPNAMENPQKIKLVLKVLECWDHGFIWIYIYIYMDLYWFMCDSFDVTAFEIVNHIDESPTWPSRKGLWHVQTVTPPATNCLIRDGESPWFLKSRAERNSHVIFQIGMFWKDGRCGESHQSISWHLGRPWQHHCWERKWLRQETSSRSRPWAGRCCCPSTTLPVRVSWKLPQRLENVGPSGERNGRCSNWIQLIPSVQMVPGPSLAFDLELYGGPGLSLLGEEVWLPPAPAPAPLRPEGKPVRPAVSARDPDWHNDK